MPNLIPQQIFRNYTGLLLRSILLATAILALFNSSSLGETAQEECKRAEEWMIKAENPQYLWMGLIGYTATYIDIAIKNNCIEAINKAEKIFENREVIGRRVLEGQRGKVKKLNHELFDSAVRLYANGRKKPLEVFMLELKRHADSGDAEAAYSVGYIQIYEFHLANENDRDVDVRQSLFSYREALKYLKLAASQEHGLAADILKEYVPSTEEQFQLLIIASRSSDQLTAKQAHHELGRLYREGGHTNPPSHPVYTKALEHFEAAKARYDVALAYALGQGTKLDLKKAGKLLVDDLRTGSIVALTGPSSTKALYEPFPKATISEAQERMRELGFYSGKIDGLVGPRFINGAKELAKSCDPPLGVALPRHCLRDSDRLE